MSIDEFLDGLFDNIEKTAGKVSGKIRQTDTFKRYQQADDPVGTFLDDASRVVTTTFDTVSRKAGPAVKNVKKKTYDMLYERYRKAGEPYGAGDEGFKKWTAEREQQMKDSAVRTGKRVWKGVRTGVDQGRRTVAEGVRNYRNSRAARNSAPMEDPVERPSENREE